jgi:hypothetical protein
MKLKMTIICCLFLLQACHREAVGDGTYLPQLNLILEGEWNIVSYQDSTGDPSAGITKFTLEFDENHMVKAISEDDMLIGKWRIYYGQRSDDAYPPYRLELIFTDIDDNYKTICISNLWTVTSYTSNRIECVYADAPNKVLINMVLKRSNSS